MLDESFFHKHVNLHCEFAKYWAKQVPTSKRKAFEKRCVLLKRRLEAVELS